MGIGGRGCFGFGEGREGERDDGKVKIEVKFFWIAISYAYSGLDQWANGYFKFGYVLPSMEPKAIL